MSDVSENRQARFANQVFNTYPILMVIIQKQKTKKCFGGQIK